MKHEDNKDERFPDTPRYAYRRLLGEGGMGAVFEAWDTRLERAVAIKVLSDELAMDPVSRTRFVREARAMASVRHHRVVQIFEVVGEGPRPYMVQELLRGKDLSARSTEMGAYSAEETLVLARELAEGLAALHDEGLVHRDLKPSNVFISEKGGVKLLDFGLVLDDEQTRLTRHGTVMGSLSYLSPEMIVCGDVTAASDVYQFGLVLHRLLSGRFLDRPSNLLWGDLFDVADENKPVPEPDESIRPDLRELIRGCCKKDPLLRPPDGRALLALIGSFRPKRGGLAATVEAPSPPSPRRPGRPWRFSAIVLVVLLIVVGALLLTRRNSPRSTRRDPPPGLAGVGGTMALFPDGFFITLPLGAARSPAWSVCGTKGKAIAGTFVRRADHWESEAKGLDRRAFLHLRVQDGRRLIEAQTLKLPAKVFREPLRVRCGPGVFSLRWSLHGKARAQVYFRRGASGSLEDQGRYAGEFSYFSSVLASATKVGATCAYALRLGKRTLAAALALPVGPRTRFVSAWLRTTAGPLRCMGARFREGRLHQVYLRSLITSSVRRETTTGAVLTPRWLFDAKAFATHRKLSTTTKHASIVDLSTDRLGVLLNTTPAQFVVLRPSFRSSLWSNRFGGPSFPNSRKALSFAASPEGMRLGEKEQVIPLVSNPLFFARFVAVDEHRLLILGSDGSANKVLAELIDLRRSVSRSLGFELPCARVSCAAMTNEALYLCTVDGDGRLHLSCLAGGLGRWKLAWSRLIPTELRHRSLAHFRSSMVRLSQRGPVYMAVENRLYILSGTAAPKVLSLPSIGPGWTSPFVTVGSEGLAFLTVSVAEFSPARMLQSEVRCLRVLPGKAGEIPLVKMSPAPATVPRLHDRAPLTNMVHHGKRLYAGAFASLCVFDAKAPSALRRRIVESQDHLTLFVDDGVLFSVLASGGIRGLDLR